MIKMFKRALLEVVVAVVRVLTFFFCPIKGIGKENVPTDRGVIICPNHISAFDAICIYLTSPRRLNFMAKSELFNTAYKRFFLDMAGAFPVVRGSGGAAAVEHSIDLIKNNHAICIFIEGTRTKNADGSPGKPKAGSVMIATQANCDIIPVAICYKHRKPRLFCKNYVYYGTPIHSDEIKTDLKSKTELRAACDKIMGSILNLWKKGNEQWQK